MKRVVTQKDIYNFCLLTGDKNPLHLDRGYAEKTRFKQIIAPGMFIASFIPAALVEQYGNGAIYVSQELEFVKPVHVDDEVEVFLQEAEVERYSDFRRPSRQGRTILINTMCKVEDNIVLKGTAKVLTYRPVSLPHGPVLTEFYKKNKIAT